MGETKNCPFRIYKEQTANACVMRFYPCDKENCMAYENGKCKMLEGNSYLYSSELLQGLKKLREGGDCEQK